MANGYEPGRSMVLAGTLVKGKVDISALTFKMERAAQKAVFRLGQETRDMARKAAPVNTGALRASIYVARPGSIPAQLNGHISRGSSRGYLMAAQKAIRLNPGQLELITDDPMISARTQRSVAPRGHVNHLTRIRVTLAHVGEHASLGQETYQGFEDDFRSIMQMGGQTRDTFYVTVGAAAYYAGFVEYGTRHQRAQPFMTPALAWARTQLPERLKMALGDEAAHIKIVGK